MTDETNKPRQSFTSGLKAMLIGFLLAIGLLAIAFVLLGFVCFLVFDAVLGRTPQEEATLTAIAPLTATYGDEARTALEAYLTVSGSHHSELHREKLAEVATYPFLDRLLEFDGPQRNDLIWVTRNFTIMNLDVLEYTPERMRIFSCVTTHIDKLTIQGEYVASLQPGMSRGFDTFVREDGVWKLAAAYGYWERSDALRDWAYVSTEERELIGDLPAYMELGFSCGYP